MFYATKKYNKGGTDSFELTNVLCKCILSVAKEL